MPTDPRVNLRIIPRSRRRVPALGNADHPRVLAAARLDAVAATLESVPDLRRELLFLALSLVAADPSDHRADATAAAVLGDTPERAS